MNRHIGFIGLGSMGSRLAANLAIDHGDMTVWNRTASVAEERAPKGSTVAKDIMTLVRQCDVIFVSVTDDKADTEVVRRITEQDLTDKTIIDFSTISPAVSINLAEQVWRKHGNMLDVGVSGSTPQVESRSLIILVGGDEQIFATHKPYIEPLGTATFYMGQSGSGLKMKLCVNALLGIGVQALAEALVLGQKSGLDRNKVIEVLNSTVVVSPSQKIKLALARSGDYTQVAFALSLMYKDFGLILDQAQEVSALMPITAASRQIAAAGIAEGEEVDFAAVIRVLENMARV